MKLLNNLLCFSLVAQLSVPAHAENVNTPVTPELLRLTPISFTPQDDSFENVDIKPLYGDLRGWEHLFRQLVMYGANPDELAALFQDHRVPPFHNLVFSVNPRESHATYRNINTASRRKRALKLYTENVEYFELAEQKYAVPQSVILAILHVETNSGAFTGKSSVFHGLARLAAAATPSNVDLVYARTKKSNKSVTRADVEKRAHYLEGTFLPHVAATLQVAKHLGQHPLELKGSYSGAMGLPQFLPGSIVRYGVDANQDRKVDLFDAPDAILSTAHYLASHGWSKETSALSEKRAIIWHYNRSEPYIDTVLDVAKSLNIQLLAYRQEQQKRG